MTIKTMLGLGIGVLLSLVLLVPAPAAAQWAFSWDTTGATGPFGEFEYHVSATSPADLAPRPDLGATFPHDPTGPVYSLTFQFGGQAFGGLVSDSSGWGPTAWLFPGQSQPLLATGVFHLADDAAFSISVGTAPGGHPRAFLSGTGTRIAAAAEPGVLTWLVVGLAAAGALGWPRRA